MPPRSSFLRGISRALPIMLGYIPTGLAFGVLAHGAGLTPGAVFCMSAIVYAGSSQFMAMGMLAGAAGFLPIVVATFFINLRHLLMSAALSPHLRRFGPARLACFAYGLTDESFALHSTAYTAGKDPFYAEMVSLNGAAMFTWVFSTTLGCMAGNLIPDPSSLGLDFALPAMFLGLLVVRLAGRRHMAVAVLAAAGALAGAAVLPGYWNIILAAAIAAGLGAVQR